MVDIIQPNKARKEKVAMLISTIYGANICVDPGTVNTSIFVNKKGVVLFQPSLIALKSNGSVLAIGDEVKKMIGRTPENVKIYKPIQNGVVVNFDLAKAMLNHFFSKVFRLRTPLAKRVVVPLSTGVTDIEKRALHEAIRQAGLKNVFFIEAPIADALGANIPIDEETGRMIVNVGGGTTEIAVLSFGGIVTSCCVHLGGEYMNQAIVKHIKRNHGMAIGERTAEEIKIKIGSASRIPLEYMDIRGKDIISGLPRSCTVSSQEIQEALAEAVEVIIKNIKDTLERTPLELALDIMRTGITLTGGGSLLKGLRKAVSEATGIPVQLAGNPLEGNVLGAGKIVIDHNLWKNLSVVAQEAR